MVLTGFLSACSGSGGGAQYPGNTVNPSAMPPGTGGISFQLVFQQPSSGLSEHIVAVAFNSCVDYGLGTIAATVTSGATIVASTSWPCALHQGVILGVPAGPNYTVQVKGLSGTTTLWSGNSTPITVSAGQLTNAGTVTMAYVGTGLGTPTVTSSGPNSNPTSTTNVPVTDRFNIVFSNPMQISTVASPNTNITLGTVPGNVSYDIASRTASFISSPTATLAYNTQYVLQVVSCVTGSCIKDIAGTQLSTSYTNTFTTESAPTGTTNAPTGLTAKPGNGQVRLDWPALNGATSYNVYYSISSPVSTATGTQILGVRAPALHLGLTNGTPYYYIVTAVNSFGESLASAQSGTTPTAPAGNPLPPASLAVNFNTGTNTNTVTWPSGSGLSHNLYWSTRAIYPDHTAADNVIRYVEKASGGSDGQYVHSGVSSGVTYCYIVTAVNAAAESADSMQVCGPAAGSIQVVWP